MYEEKHILLQLILLGNYNSKSFNSSYTLDWLRIKKNIYSTMKQNAFVLDINTYIDPFQHFLVYEILYDQRFILHSAFQGHRARLLYFFLGEMLRRYIKIVINMPLLKQGS